MSATGTAVKIGGLLIAFNVVASAFQAGNELANHGLGNTQVASETFANTMGRHFAENAGNAAALLWSAAQGVWNIGSAFVEGGADKVQGNNFGLNGPTS